MPELPIGPEILTDYPITCDTSLPEALSGLVTDAQRTAIIRSELFLCRPGAHLVFHVRHLWKVHLARHGSDAVRGSAMPTPRLARSIPPAAVDAVGHMRGFATVGTVLPPHGAKGVTDAAAT
jgi:hypothetical protein